VPGAAPGTVRCRQRTQPVGTSRVGLSAGRETLIEHPKTRAHQRFAIFSGTWEAKYPAGAGPWFSVFSVAGWRIRKSVIMG